MLARLTFNKINLFSQTNKNSKFLIPSFAKKKKIQIALSTESDIEWTSKPIKTLQSSFFTIYCSYHIWLISKSLDFLNQKLLKSVKLMEVFSKLHCWVKHLQNLLVFNENVCIPVRCPIFLSRLQKTEFIKTVTTAQILCIIHVDLDQWNVSFDVQMSREWIKFLAFARSFWAKVQNGNASIFIKNILYLFLWVGKKSNHLL